MLFAHSRNSTKTTRKNVNPQMKLGHLEVHQLERDFVGKIVIDIA